MTWLTATFPVVAKKLSFDVSFAPAFSLSPRLVQSCNSTLIWQDQRHRYQTSTIRIYYICTIYSTRRERKINEGRPKTSIRPPGWCKYTKAICSCLRSNLEYGIGLGHANVIQANVKQQKRRKNILSHGQFSENCIAAASILQGSIDDDFSGRAGLSCSHTQGWTSFDSFPSSAKKRFHLNQFLIMLKAFSILSPGPVASWADVRPGLDIEIERGASAKSVFLRSWDCSMRS